MTPCLAPLAPFRNDIHVLTGLDNPAARLPGPGNGHHHSMSGSDDAARRSRGRGAGGASIDQAIAAKIGGESRFRSLQIGVSQESFGESMQRNMSWAGYDRALPPEMIPHKLFDRLFGAARRRLGQPQDEHPRRRAAGRRRAEEEARPTDDQRRVDEHLSGIRDLERAIAGLPPEYRKVDPPDFDGDMKDWPRIAKLQSDLLVQALATRQTRVASYMLTKCQGLSRFPWLGYTAARHHDYTHRRRQGARRRRRRTGSAFCATSASGTSRSSPIWWQAEVDSRRRPDAARPHVLGLRARACRGERHKNNGLVDDRRRTRRFDAHRPAHADDGHDRRFVSHDCGRRAGCGAGAIPDGYA